MTIMLSLIPAVYCSVCFDDLVIVWESKLANIEALKSNGKQLVSSLMTDCVWLFVWEPGDTESSWVYNIFWRHASSREDYSVK